MAPSGTVSPTTNRTANAGRASATGPELAGKLLDQARAAKALGWTDQGMRYDLRTDAALEDLDRAADGLAGFDPLDQLHDRNDALAFWINLYNAIVIHWALRFRVRRSMTEVPRFFRRAGCDLGGRRYSLDVIEHGLLRANRGHPSRVVLPQLMPGDSRRALVICPMDRRIHFALNCGAVSCPPLRHYTPDNIEAELEMAARSFVNAGGVRVDPQPAPKGGGVLLSLIFLWYDRDLGWTKRRQLASVLDYIDSNRRREIEAAARRGIRYADYDWSFA